MKVFNYIWLPFCVLCAVFISSCNRGKIMPPPLSGSMYYDNMEDDYDVVEVPFKIQDRACIQVNPNVSEVEVGQEYTFTCPGCGDGTWAVEGYEKPDKPNALTITVKCVVWDGHEKAVVSYTPISPSDKVKRWLCLPYKK